MFLLMKLHLCKLAHAFQNKAKLEKVPGNKSLPSTPQHGAKGPNPHTIVVSLPGDSSER